MQKNSSILVLGSTGMVGSAIVAQLQTCGYTNILSPSSIELNCLNTDVVNQYLEYFKPEYVFLSAAKVGGIIANRDAPVDFLYENLQIQNNVINAAAYWDVKKLLFTGSSCIYPKISRQPIKEEYLMRGPLEETNQSYAIAKIAGIQLCKSYNEQYGKNFISVMPCNLYGPGDNYHPTYSHVIPGLIRRFHEAKKENKPTVVIWGSGTPLREFMYSTDLAACMVQLMEYSGQLPHLINIGTNVEVNIAYLAELIKYATGYTGEILLDKDKPDGTPRKVLDCGVLHNIPDFNWQPTVGLQDGLQMAYQDFCNNHN